MWHVTLLPTLPQDTALLDLLRKQAVRQEDRNYCPWQSELPSAESKRLLTLLVRHALWNAASLLEDGVPR